MSARRLRTVVSPMWRGRAEWAVPLLLFLAILLVAALAFNVANLDTGGEAIPGAGAAGGTGPSALGAFDPILADVILVVFAGFVVATLVYAFRGRRVHSKALMKPFSWLQVFSSIMGLVFLIAFLVAWPRVIQALRAGQTNSTTSDAGAVNGTAWPAAAGAPGSLFLGLLVLATIVLLVALLRRGGGHTEMETEPPGDDPAARHAAAEAVQDAIEELEVGGDVRSVILACFRRFCALLGARGITDQGPLTPRELERLAVERLQVSREASGTLTSLFEEARYSEHPLGDADRHRAIESLAGIRAALGA
ncbi:hypothetical protein AUF72_01285 [Euryarchaeota archaeon 13_1_20CM_2_64_92]|nr:MAG: hypothetical protein AUF72_01285 [Euryarchaeota archaeon 13_1_20CM_2_64_92]